MQLLVNIQKDNPTLWASSTGTENSEYYKSFVPWGCITTQYSIVNNTLGINTFPYNGMLFKHIVEKIPKALNIL